MFLLLFLIQLRMGYFIKQNTPHNVDTDVILYNVIPGVDYFPLTACSSMIYLLYVCTYVSIITNYKFKFLELRIRALLLDLG